MKDTITYLAILLTICMMMLGCLTEKKAQRLLLKVQVKQPKVLTDICAEKFSNTEYLIDTFFYKEGIPQQEVVAFHVDCDTLTNQIDPKGKLITTIQCPSVVSRVDTVYRIREVRVVNKAELVLLQEKLFNREQQLAKLQTRNSLLLKLAVVLGIYTIARWILRFWNIKLP